MARRPGQIMDEQEKLESLEKMEALAAEGSSVQPEDQPAKRSNMPSLRDLVFLGRLSRKEDIGGFIFEVQTLTVSEQKDMMKQVMKIDDIERILGLRMVILSYAVRSVNGVPLEELCEDDSLTSAEERRVSVISSLQASLAEKLHKVYDELVNETKEDGTEDIKK